MRFYSWRQWFSPTSSARTSQAEEKERTTLEPSRSDSIDRRCCSKLRAKSPTTAHGQTYYYSIHGEHLPHPSSRRKLRRIWVGEELAGGGRLSRLKGRGRQEEPHLRLSTPRMRLS